MEQDQQVALPAANGMAKVSGNGLGYHPSAAVIDRQLLAAQVDELILANRRKDEFLAILSHELRSPLASVQFGITVLRGPSGTDPTVQRGMQELIERQVRQMTLLAAGLLDARRIASGQLQVQLERVDLRAVLTNAMETLEPDVAKRGQALRATWVDSSLWVMADASRLEQVFVNLLANASKYTDTGGKIEVSLSTQDAEAIVHIKDSGIGITADLLPHIFDLFVQADATSIRSRSGMGIGLALVRTIVGLHGGRVSAASAGLGQGSEFFVRLPREA
jgi:signal transduction histidine kinase